MSSSVSGRRRSSARPASAFSTAYNARPSTSHSSYMSYSALLNPSSSSSAAPSARQAWSDRPTSAARAPSQPQTQPPFQSFASSLPAVPSSSLDSLTAAARARASLIDRERRLLFSYLSSPECSLFSQVTGPVELTESDLDLLLGASGSGQVALQFLRSFDSARRKFLNFPDLIQAVYAAHLKDLEDKQKTLEFLNSPACTLFSPPGSYRFSLSDVERLFIESGAFSHSMHFLVSFQRAGKAFNNLSTLIQAIKESEVELEKKKQKRRETAKSASGNVGKSASQPVQPNPNNPQQSARLLVLQYLSSPVCQIFANAGEIRATASQLDSLLSLQSSATEAVDLLMHMDAKGIQCKTFAELLNAATEHLKQQQQVSKKPEPEQKLASSEEFHPSLAAPSADSASPPPKPRRPSSPPPSNPNSYAISSPQRRASTRPVDSVPSHYERQRAELVHFLSSPHITLFSELESEIRVEASELDSLLQLFEGGETPAVQGAIDLLEELNSRSLRFSSFSALVAHARSRVAEQRQVEANRNAEKQAILNFLSSPDCRLFDRELSVEQRELDDLLSNTDSLALPILQSLNFLVQHPQDIQPPQMFRTFTDLTNTVLENYGQLMKMKASLFARLSRAAIFYGKFRITMDQISESLAATGAALLMAERIFENIVSQKKRFHSFQQFKDRVAKEAAKFLKDWIDEEENEKANQAAKEAETLKIAAQKSTAQRWKDAERAVVVDYLSDSDCLLFTSEAAAASGGEIHIRKSELDQLITHAGSPQACVELLKSLNQAGKQYNGIAELLNDLKNSAELSRPNERSEIEFPDLPEPTESDLRDYISSPNFTLLSNSSDVSVPSVLSSCGGSPFRALVALRFFSFHHRRFPSFLILQEFLKDFCSAASKCLPDLLSLCQQMRDIGLLEYTPTVRVADFLFWHSGAGPLSLQFAQDCIGSRTAETAAFPSVASLVSDFQSRFQRYCDVRSFQLSLSLRFCRSPALYLVEPLGDDLPSINSEDVGHFLSLCSSCPNFIYNAISLLFSGGSSSRSLPFSPRSSSSSHWNGVLANLKQLVLDSSANFNVSYQELLQFFFHADCAVLKDVALQPVEIEQFARDIRAKFGREHSAILAAPFNSAAALFPVPNPAAFNVLLYLHAINSNPGEFYVSSLDSLMDKILSLDRLTRSSLDWQRRLAIFALLLAEFNYNPVFNAGSAESSPLFRISFSQIDSLLTAACHDAERLTRFLLRLFHLEYDAAGRQTNRIAAYFTDFSLLLSAVSVCQERYSACEARLRDLIEKSNFELGGSPLHPDSSQLSALFDFLDDDAQVFQFFSSYLSHQRSAGAVKRPFDARSLSHSIANFNTTFLPGVLRQMAREKSQIRSSFPEMKLPLSARECDYLLSCLGGIRTVRLCKRCVQFELQSKSSAANPFGDFQSLFSALLSSLPALKRLRDGVLSLVSSSSSLLFSSSPFVPAADSLDDFLIEMDAFQPEFSSVFQHFLRQSDLAKRFKSLSDAIPLLKSFIELRRIHSESEFEEIQRILINCRSKPGFNALFQSDSGFDAFKFAQQLYFAAVRVTKSNFVAAEIASELAEAWNSAADAAIQANSTEEIKNALESAVSERFGFVSLVCEALGDNCPPVGHRWRLCSALRGEFTADSDRAGLPALIRISRSENAEFYSGLGQIIDEARLNSLIQKLKSGPAASESGKGSDAAHLSPLEAEFSIVSYIISPSRPFFRAHSSPVLLGDSHISHLLSVFSHSGSLSHSVSEILHYLQFFHASDSAFSSVSDLLAALSARRNEIQLESNKILQFLNRSILEYYCGEAQFAAKLNSIDVSNLIRCTTEIPQEHFLSYLKRLQLHNLHQKPPSESAVSGSASSLSPQLSAISHTLTSLYRSDLPYFAQLKQMIRIFLSSPVCEFSLPSITVDSQDGSRLHVPELTEAQPLTDGFLNELIRIAESPLSLFLLLVQASQDKLKFSTPAALQNYLQTAVSNTFASKLELFNFLTNSAKPEGNLRFSPSHALVEQLYGLTGELSLLLLSRLLHPAGSKPEYRSAADFSSDFARFANDSLSRDRQLRLCIVAFLQSKLFPDSSDFALSDSDLDQLFALVEQPDFNPSDPQNAAADAQPTTFSSLLLEILSLSHERSTSSDPPLMMFSDFLASLRDRLVSAKSSAQRLADFLSTDGIRLLDSSAQRQSLCEYTGEKYKSLLSSSGAPRFQPSSNPNEALINTLELTVSAAGDKAAFARVAQRLFEESGLHSAVVAESGVLLSVGHSFPSVFSLLSALQRRARSSHYSAQQSRIKARLDAAQREIQENKRKLQQMELLKKSEEENRKKLAELERQRAEEEEKMRVEREEERKKMEKEAEERKKAEEEKAKIEAELKAKQEDEERERERKQKEIEEQIKKEKELELEQQRIKEEEEAKRKAAEAEAEAEAEREKQKEAERVAREKQEEEQKIKQEAKAKEEKASEQQAEKEPAEEEKAQEKQPEADSEARQQKEMEIKLQKEKEEKEKEEQAKAKAEAEAEAERQREEAKRLESERQKAEEEKRRQEEQKRMEEEKKRAEQAEKAKQEQIKLEQEKAAKEAEAKKQAAAEEERKRKEKEAAEAKAAEEKKQAESSKTAVKEVDEIEPCEICDDHPSEVYCEECGMQMCVKNFCDQDMHGSVRKQSHKRLPLALKGANEKAQKAEEEAKAKRLEELKAIADAAEAEKAKQAAAAAAAQNQNLHYYSGATPECAICEEQPAEVFCPSCSQYLCKANGCDAEVHAANRTKAHIRLTIAPKSAEGAKPAPQPVVSPAPAAAPTPAPAAAPAKPVVRPQCDVCDENLADVYCSQCQLNLCISGENCDAQVHGTAKAKQHIRKPLAATEQNTETEPQQAKKPPALQIESPAASKPVVQPPQSPAANIASPRSVRSPAGASGAAPRADHSLLIDCLSTGNLFSDVDGEIDVDTSHLDELIAVAESAERAVAGLRYLDQRGVKLRSSQDIMPEMNKAIQSNGGQFPIFGETSPMVGLPDNRVTSSLIASYISANCQLFKAALDVAAAELEAFIKECNGSPYQAMQSIRALEAANQRFDTFAEFQQFVRDTRKLVNSQLASIEKSLREAKLFGSIPAKIETWELELLCLAAPSVEDLMQELAKLSRFQGQSKAINSMRDLLESLIDCGTTGTHLGAKDKQDLLEYLSSSEEVAAVFASELDANGQDLDELFESAGFSVPAVRNAIKHIAAAGKKFNTFQAIIPEVRAALQAAK